MNSLTSSQVISLDTNIFIRALDDPTDLGVKARELITQIREKTPRVFISTILIEEFFVRVYKDRREQGETSILDFLTIGGLAIFVSMDRQVALLAAKIRADYPSLKAPDAIHLATAIVSGSKLFITTDKRIPKNIKGLKIVVLSKTN